MRCSAHFLSSSRQAARDRALELTGPDSKRPRATHQLDLEAEAEVKRERRKDRKEDDARVSSQPLHPHSSLVFRLSMPLQRLTASLALDKPYDIKPVPRPRGW